MGRDFFAEELSTPNLRGGRPCLIFSIQGAPKKTEVAYGQLEALCKKCQDEIPSEPVVPDVPPEPGQPYPSAPGPARVRRGFCRFQRTGRWRAAAVHRVWNRPSPPDRIPSADPRQPALAAEAANLPEVLHWIYNNKPSQFRRIEAQVQKTHPAPGQTPHPHRAAGDHAGADGSAR